MPRRCAATRCSSWRWTGCPRVQFDSLRLRVIKIAARVVELKTQIKIHLPLSAPDQRIFHLALDHLPRLAT
jgi:hypothetical protein